MEFVLPSALAIVLSLLSPYIVAFYTKASMSSQTKNLVALGVSLVIAVGWTVASGGFGALVIGSGVPALLDSILPGLAMAYGLQQAVFNVLFKNTGLAESITNNYGITDGETDSSGSGFDAETEGLGR